MSEHLKMKADITVPFKGTEVWITKTSYDHLKIRIHKRNFLSEKDILKYKYLLHDKTQIV